MDTEQEESKRERIEQQKRWEKRQVQMINDAIEALSAIERSTWTTDSPLAKISLPKLEDCLNDLKKTKK